VKTKSKIINYTPPRWRVSWHQRDKVLRGHVVLCWRDFVDHTDAVDWLHFCEDRRDFYRWPFMYCIEKKSEKS
jgi:hypothetical protein